MLSLKETVVRRGGETARHWYETIRRVSASASSKLHLSFSVDSKGGGVTQVQVEISPEDFPTILQLMSVVDRQAAMQAMSVELAAQVQTQPESDTASLEIASKEAIDTVWRKTERNHPIRFLGNNKDEDKIVRTAVSKIIAEVRTEKTSAKSGSDTGS